MTPTRNPSGLIGRGILAGIAATGVMTAFQKLVEMPLTGRAESMPLQTSPNGSCRCTPGRRRAADG